MSDELDHLRDDYFDEEGYRDYLYDCAHPQEYATDCSLVWILLGPILFLMAVIAIGLFIYK